MPAAFDDIRKEAQEAHAQQRWLVAEQHYRTLLENNPSAEDVINLGALLRSQGRYQEGSLFYKHWLLRFSNNYTLLLNACNCWNDAGQAGLSLEHLRCAIQYSPNDSKLQLAIADAWMHAGRPDQSLSTLQELASKEGATKGLLIRLGLCHARLQQLHQALEAFNRAQDFDAKDLQILANRLTILKDLGRFTDAEILLEDLTTHEIEQTDIANAIAGLWMAQKKLAKATILYQQLAKQKPQEAGYWLNWAAALRGLRLTVAPHNVLKRGLLHQPLDLELQQALMQLLAEMALPEAVQRLQQLWPHDTGQLKQSHLFSQQFLGIGAAPADSQALAKQAQQWEKHCQSNASGPLWPDQILETLSGRRLRVGYLSADLANHPVGRFLLPVLSHHDRATIETWLLNVGSHDDWITEHLRGRADHWLDLRFRTSLQAARQVAELRLDVLVELGGFTGESALEIICHRPAPVQLSYLGYPGPTYLRSIDGWIGDQVLFGQLNACDREAHKLIVLEGGYMVFDSGGELPTPNRCEAPRFRFGSFNHARKLSRATIELFCKVLAANPETELVLKSISFIEPAEQQRIRERFVAAGLASERLILLNWVEGGLNHLQLYREMDVALDPIPYGGATTTAEALWMGVPVVALAGEGMVGRLAASLLIHGGCSEWVADDADHYVAIASQLAAQGPRNGRTRQALRRSLQRSALADGARLSRELERHYRAMRNAVRPY